MRAKERRPCLAIRRLVNARWDRRKGGKAQQCMTWRARIKRGRDRDTPSQSLSQFTDLRYKAIIWDPNFVKKVGTFFGLGTQLKRMK